MLQRYIHRILTTGIQTIKDDPKFLEDLFSYNWEVLPEELATIQQHFADHPLNVINGYPRSDSEFPLVAIILGQEDEAEHYLGDYAGYIEDEDNPDYQADIESSMWQHHYRLPVYSEHVDITASFYEVVKAIMISGLSVLVDDGCYEFHLSGMDLAPDPKYLPEHLFGRVLTFSCRREFQTINRGARLWKAFKVSGIHIDKSGSPSEIGDVKTKVGIFGVGEDDG